jgi:hypothetical protein
MGTRVNTCCRTKNGGRALSGSLLYCIQNWTKYLFAKVYVLRFEDKVKRCPLPGVSPYRCAHETTSKKDTDRNALTTRNWCTTLLATPSPSASLPLVIAARHKSCPRTTPAIAPVLVQLRPLIPKIPAPNPRPHPRLCPCPCSSPNRKSTGSKTMTTIIMGMMSKRTIMTDRSTSASANTAQPQHPLPHNNPSNRCHPCSSNNHSPRQRQRPARSSPTYTSTRACALPAASVTREEPTHSVTPLIPTHPPRPSPYRYVSAPATRCHARHWPSAYPVSPRRRSRSAGRPRPWQPCLGYGRGTTSMRRFFAPRVCPLRTARLGTVTLSTITLIGTTTNRTLRMTLCMEDGHGER